MNSTPVNVNKKVFFPVLLSFFVMGFVDIVGISANYVKKDFGLSDSLANLIPMMSFLWFAIISVPTGLLMKKIGRRPTVFVSLVVTIITMVIPLVGYSYMGMLFCFALLGIGNTILQVSLNPLVSDIVSRDKLTSTLTLGQFIKAISSFLGPIIAAFSQSVFHNWKMTFLLYGVVSVIAAIWLISTKMNETKEVSGKVSSFGELAALLKDSYLVKCILVILLIVGIDVSLNASIPRLLMHQLQMPLSTAGIGTSLYFAARTIGTLLGTFLLMKYPPVKFLQRSVLVAIIAYALLIFIPNQWLMYLFIVLVGVACANVFSIIFSLALQHDMNHSNEISSLMIMGVLGGAILPPLQGVCSDHISFVASMLLVLICLVIVEILSFRLQKIKN